jgi:rare lipoprotein A (peptidoglycan hydrolase)
MMRTRQAGASASVLAAYAAALSLSTPSLAKTPGEVHCYNGICHRVKAVEEMQVLVGTQTDAMTSYYDIPERDRMNVGTITSSGEEFDADSDQHAASSLYPDGTELLVWNPKNQKAAHIRVNDFGPFYMMRTIDVTRGVAEKLEFHKTGVAKLRVIVLWAPSREEARFRRHRVYPAAVNLSSRAWLRAIVWQCCQRSPARKRAARGSSARRSFSTPRRVSSPSIFPILDYSPHDQRPCRLR